MKSVFAKKGISVLLAFVLAVSLVTPALAADDVDEDVDVGEIAEEGKNINNDNNEETQVFDTDITGNTDTTVPDEAQPVYYYSEYDNDGCFHLYLCSENWLGSDPYTYEEVPMESADPPWISGIKSDKVIVTINDDIYPESTYEWFYHGSGIEEFQNLNYLHTDYTTTTRRMFYACSEMTDYVDYIKNMNLSNCSNIWEFFAYTTINADLDLSKWNINNGNPFQAEATFSNCGLNSIILPESNFKPTDLAGFLYNNDELVSIKNLDKIDASELTEITNMLARCSNLKSVDISTWEIKNNIRMAAAFASMTSLETIILPESPFSVTAGGITGIFSNDENLTTIKNLLSVDVINVTGVEGDSSNGFGGVFCNCSSLEQLDISSWDMSNGKTFINMLTGCSSLKKISINNPYNGAVTFPSDISETWYTSDGEEFNYAEIPEGINTYYANQDESIIPTDALSTYCFWDGTDLFLTSSKQNAIENGMDYYELELGKSNPWNENTLNGNTESDITSVTILSTNGGIWPSSTAYLFCGFENAVFDGLVYVHTDYATDMSYMFYKCNHLTQKDADIISDFNTEKCTKMASTFEGVAGYYTYSDGCVTAIKTLDLSKWDISKVKDITSMFKDMYGHRSGYTSENDSYGTRKIVLPGCGNNGENDISVQPNAMEKLFSGDELLETIENLNLIETSEVDSFAYLFYNCNFLKEADVGGWDTGNVTDMSYMFCCHDSTSSGVNNGHNSLTTVDVSNWNTGNVTTMYYMFYCYIENEIEYLDVSNWDTSSVTDFRDMFRNCKHLTTLDVSEWNTSSAIQMGYLFGYCSDLTDIDVSKWDISNATSIVCIFIDCTSLKELDLTNWDTKNVEDMGSLFYGDESLEKIYVGEGQFNTDKIVENKGLAMFTGCEKLVGGNETGYNKDKVNYEMAHVDTEENPGYFTLSPTISHDVHTLPDKAVWTWDISDINNPTCTIYAVCEVCGEKIYGDTIIVSSTIIKEPTCADTGEIQFLAYGWINNGEEDIPYTDLYAATLSATGEHTPDYDEPITVDFTSVATTGKATVTYTCKVCGEKFTELVDVEYEVQYTYNSSTGEYNDNPSSVVMSVKITDPETGITYNFWTETDAEEMLGGNHNWVLDAIGSSPTCTVDGYTVYYCTHCGATRTDIDKAYGHDWDLNMYSSSNEHGVTHMWSMNYQSCVFTFTCLRCGGRESISAEVTSTSANGSTTYTASCVFEGKTFSTSVTVNALGQTVDGDLGTGTIGSNNSNNSNNGTGSTYNGALGDTTVGDARTTAKAQTDDSATASETSSGSGDGNSTVSGATATNTNGTTTEGTSATETGGVKTGERVGISALACAVLAIIGSACAGVAARKKKAEEN